MIWASKCVEIVRKSFMKKRTSIGLVGFISLNTGAKFGGVVEKLERINKDVSSKNMSARKTKMKTANPEGHPSISSPPCRTSSTPPCAKPFCEQCHHHCGGRPNKMPCNGCGSTCSSTALQRRDAQSLIRVCMVSHNIGS